ncbi:MAG: metallophosphatase family protein [Candidatus Dormibacteraeota bacterium]|nr:metallophosphatase family protein [Candidatus Dormibacteraeota bacterium]
MPPKRIAALYDIHGNLPALKAALEAARASACEALVFGGDVAAGYMPAETLSVLMDLRPRPRFVMGNADRELTRIWDGGEAPPGFMGELAAWAARRLDQQQRDFLASFEPVVDSEVAGLGRVLFCHGTPASDEEIVTPETPEAVLAEFLDTSTADIVVGGHTHMQMNRSIAGTRFVNAGSVGMPYGGTGAFWLLLGPTVGLRRTPYDLEAAAAAIRATGGPGATEFAAQNVLATPPAKDAIDVFERQAGRRG